MSPAGLQGIIAAITQLGRGGPGKDYVAKLHDCGAITDGPPFSGLCSLLDGSAPLTCALLSSWWCSRVASRRC